MMRVRTFIKAKDDEEIHLFLRRHWTVPFGIFLGLVLLAVIPYGFALFTESLWKPLLDIPFYAALFPLVAGLYAILIWTMAFLQFTDYYLDVWIVTDRRIVNIEQNGLFHRTASELHLASVEDVTSDVGGFFHTLLNYGHVHVQTAAEKLHFSFEGVPHPEAVRETIIRLVEEEKLQHRESAPSKVV